MKTYVAVEKSYDYYEFQHNIIASTSYDLVMEAVENRKKRLGGMPDMEVIREWDVDAPFKYNAARDDGRCFIYIEEYND